MPAVVKGLSETLRGARDLLKQVDVAKERLTTHVSDLSDAVSQVNEFTNQVQKATSEVRAVLGGLTNGAPADEPSDPPTQPAKTSDTTWSG